jgi:hypothetical protein
MAEREAVTAASREGTTFSLVTLLPGTVLGPHLGRSVWSLPGSSPQGGTLHSLTAFF